MVTFTLLLKQYCIGFSKQNNFSFTISVQKYCGVFRFFKQRHSILVLYHQEIESNTCHSYSGTVTLVQLVSICHIYTRANKRDYQQYVYLYDWKRESVTNLILLILHRFSLYSSTQLTTSDLQEEENLLLESWRARRLSKYEEILGTPMQCLKLAHHLRIAFSIMQLS